MDKFLNKIVYGFTVICLASVLCNAHKANAAGGIDNGCVHILDNCNNQPMRFRVMYDDVASLAGIWEGEKCRFGQWRYFKSYQECMVAQSRFPICEGDDANFEALKDHKGYYFVNPKGEFICYWDMF